jgi:Rhodopirellula transposase DDE domain
MDLADLPAADMVNRNWRPILGCTTFPSSPRGTGVTKLADETGLETSVCHFPPGTSEWNRIEHRLFSFITKNWHGKPLVSHEVIVNLIAATTTGTGLRIQCQ